MGRGGSSCECGNPWGGRISRETASSRRCAHDMYTSAPTRILLVYISAPRGRRRPTVDDNTQAAASQRLRQRCVAHARAGSIGPPDDPVRGSAAGRELR
eukprot:scaffold3456_cov340-Prasinococcus_capsulatus_cf.AAC.1